MIISRTPFRASFVGGGTDIPWFSDAFGGATLSTAIDRYMFLTAHPMFDRGILLKYSRTERVEVANDIQHPIARELLMHFRVDTIDLGVSADIPAGSGLGSSSAFTVGLAHTLANYSNLNLNKNELADLACQVEIQRLGEPIGKQDQYASAFGGFNFIEYHKDGSVEVSPVELNSESREWFDNSMYLVRIGSAARSASELLLKQSIAAKTSPQITQSLTALRSLAYESRDLVQKDIRSLGEILREAWRLKQISNPEASNDEIDQICARALKSGALGTKLLGAGQAGFILCIVEPHLAYRVLDELKDYKILKVSQDRSGATIVYNQGR